VDEGSTPKPRSELVSDLTVENGVSLEIASGIETSTKGHDMNIGTKLTFSYASRAYVKLTAMLVIVGLLEFGVGPVASIRLSHFLT
jgi:hypothetical protein